MKIGSYDVHAIETGTFWLDGGAMFGIIPKVLWEKTNKSDERNRVKLAARCLLLIGNGKIILMDTGNGEKITEKFIDLYSYESDSGNLYDSLAKYGVKPDEITDVILSHLHFDHAGGSTIRENGKIIPAFPKANYHIQKVQWDNALHPTERDRASYSANDYMALDEFKMLSLIEGEKELFPGIHIMISNGHTPGLQMLKITDGGKTIFYAADLMPFTSHIPLPYIMGFDLQPLITLNDKKRCLNLAVEENWIIFFEHDPEIIAGTVKRTEKGFIFDKPVNID
ncbi:MAG: MBL fold metallo-hydrolase [Ignavibacteriales bacterium]|nr:MBL fold metallo-hydrolase [Ignavibacteriales bacterium]